MLIINFFFGTLENKYITGYINSNYFIYINNEYYYIKILNRMFCFKFNKMKKNHTLNFKLSS